LLYSTAGALKAFKDPHRSRWSPSARTSPCWAAAPAGRARSTPPRRWSPGTASPSTSPRSLPGGGHRRDRGGGGAAERTERRSQDSSNRARRKKCGAGGTPFFSPDRRAKKNAAKFTSHTPRQRENRPIINRQGRRTRKYENTKHPRATKRGLPETPSPLPATLV